MQKIFEKPRETIANKIKHPMLLLNVPATLEFKNERDLAPAMVWLGKEPGGSKKGVYHIIVYTPSAKDMFSYHPFGGKNNYYTYTDFVVGLLAHEISHILAGALGIDHPITNDVYQEISNILDDAHDEYFMQRYYPVYAPYINATLLGLKYASSVVDGTPLRNHLGAFFDMVRFGYSPAGCDENFRDFALPIIKSSVRGGRENVRDATLAIYEYLRAVHERDKKSGWQDGMGSGTVRKIPITGSDLDALLEKGEQVMNTDQLDALTKVKESGGKFPGVGEAQIVVEEKDDDFYRNTVLEYADTIALLRKFFLQKYDKPIRRASYEGELEMSAAAQQRAYLDELLGEESKVYHVAKKELPDIKIITYRDISSSTRPFKQAFAKAIVIFHAALEGIEGVKTAHVDFSSGADLGFGFEDEVARAKVYPKAEGNTLLMPAIKLVQDFDLTARRLFHFVVTDGYISQAYECQEAIKQLGGNSCFIEVIPPGGTGDTGRYVAGFENSFSSTLEELPFELMGRLD